MIRLRHCPPEGTLDLLKSPEASQLLRGYANIGNAAVRRSVLTLARALAGQKTRTRR